ncbi:CDP-alcohol phosphatidyltransferase family protein [Vallitalea okinawensis]|uniref:CDP-alcohol phosphatidyltransferase family protein n=1 Tax=Vallitalea okinawensis TaxID=2078660 RepID=UPI000CFB4456|nr:CDP-alcohol phosphatidyltransferase family protein [Vallitalea okinawensis]
MKSIANYITMIRIILSLTLFFIEPLSQAFIIIYLICGISDILDGYIARKTNTVSEVGGKLDSLADLIMFTVLIILFYPIILIHFNIIVWIIIVTTIRLISMVIVYIKYRKFGVIHTYGNKLTGFALFMFPLLLAFNFNGYVPIMLICLIACISSIEELLIHLTSTELKINRRSIFDN